MKQPAAWLKASIVRHAVQVRESPRQISPNVTFPQNVTFFISPPGAMEPISLAESTLG